MMEITREDRRSVIDHCYLAYFISGMVILIFGVILPNLIEERNLSFTAAGGEYQTDTQKNEKQAEGTVVASPLVGIFYSAPSPEDEPFVTVGDTVKKGQTLGVIEAMKLMNEIESECDGIVKEVLVENGEMVEFGQPLFIVGV